MTTIDLITMNPKSSAKVPERAGNSPENPLAPAFPEIKRAAADFQ
jgi:hypothetical protein